MIPYAVAMVGSSDDVPVAREAFEFLRIPSGWVMGDGGMTRTGDFSHQILGDAGANRIAEELTYIPYQYVHTLILKDCNIGDVGAIALANKIGPASNIRILDLGGNWIDNHGVHAFAMALRFTSKLEILNMQSGYTHRPVNLDEGAMSMAGVLRSQRSLRELHMPHGMTSVGVDAICAALEKNTVLEELYTGEAPITTSKAIVHMLKMNKTLRYMHINITALPREDRLAIFNAQNGRTVWAITYDGDYSPWAHPSVR